MNDHIEISDDELERRMRAVLMKPSAPAAEDATEKRMIEKLFGTKTAADHFLKHNGRKVDPGKSSSRIDLRPNRPYRAPEVRIHFEYYDTPGTTLFLGGWRIERFENGSKIDVHSGQDYEKRDQLLIKFQAGGFTCKPIAIGDVLPRPIQGRAKDRPRPISGRKFIMDSLKHIDSDDVKDFEL